MKDLDLIGVCINVAVSAGTDHFIQCPECLQPIERRDLAAVFHHNGPGPEPLPVEDAERLLRADQQLRAVLERPEGRQSVRRAR